MKNFIKQNGLYIAWGFALIAMLGSLYYSNVLHLPPCVLCWYQRICMYPLVIILGFAAYRKNNDFVAPALVLAAVGWLISIYHNLLYFNILPESVAPCVAGISCTTKFTGFLAVLPIPLQALLGFTLILLTLIIYRRFTNDQRS